MSNKIMGLADDYAQLLVSLEVEKADDARSDLQAEVDRVVKDAERWQAYQARKDAAINAGMGKNPMRKEPS